MKLFKRIVRSFVVIAWYLLVPLISAINTAYDNIVEALHDTWTNDTWMYEEY